MKLPNWLVMTLGALLGTTGGIALMIKLGAGGYRDVVVAWAALGGIGLGSRELWMWRRRRLDELQHDAATSLVQATARIRDAFDFVRSRFYSSDEGFAALRETGEFNEHWEEAESRQHRLEPWERSDLERATYSVRLRGLQTALNAFHSERITHEPALGVSFQEHETKMRGVFSELYGTIIEHLDLRDPREDEEFDPKRQKELRRLVYRSSPDHDTFQPKIDEACGATEDQLRQYLLSNKVR